MSSDYRPRKLRPQLTPTLASMDPFPIPGRHAPNYKYRNAHTTPAVIAAEGSLRTDPIRRQTSDVTSDLTVERGGSAQYNDY